ncbi:hypothetical protein PR048_009788 [Dryococelus australis]|uniref:Reverse transcriptase Ty1/copia-type domain-containing protein n=1 Tax=Dryococelus australis TaxID=614101 RepID=A0ABQ9I0X8_9NEOP|nr:hypothetical protein PR048_009788 [Dryococelus australis]
MATASEDFAHVEKLRGHSNFSIWTFQIIVLLKSADLYNVVSTEVKYGEQDTNWGKKDAKAQRDIVTMIDKGNIQFTMSCDSTKGDRNKSTTSNRDKVAFLTESMGGNPEGSWVLDSGCTSHMINNNHSLTNVTGLESEMMTSKKNENMCAELKGDIEKVGHLNVDSMKKLATLSSGLEKRKFCMSEIQCETCLTSKQTKEHFGKAREREKRPLEIIHTDVCGPLDTTWDGFRKENKDRLCPRSYSSAKWTSRETEQDANGENESTLFDSGLVKKLWGEALRTATYLLNRSPPATANTTPAKLWYGKRQDLPRDNKNIKNARLTTEITTVMENCNHRGRKENKQKEDPNICKNTLLKKKYDNSYKAKLVTRDCEQKTGLNYNETFSSVVSLNTLRFLIAYTTKEDMFLKQFDIKTAFLYGNLEQDIFMLIPEGFEDEQGSHMACINLTDKSVFVNDDGNLILAIWVDDCLVISNEIDKIDELMMKLQTEFEVKITDNPEIFVSLEIENVRSFINIHQESYVDQLLKTYDMDCTKPATTPTDSGTDNTEDCNGKEGTFKERETLGLRYLTDLNTSLINTYSDADYAGDKTSRRSISGYVIPYMGSPVALSTRKQPIISLSTAESEFIAASECVKEVLFLNSLYKELTGEVIPVNLNIDNQSTIQMIRNDSMTKRSTHIDIKFKFLYEKVNQETSSLKYCPTDSQLADIFTKAGNPTVFCKLAKNNSLLQMSSICIKQ